MAGFIGRMTMVIGLVQISVIIEWHEIIFVFMVMTSGNGSILMVGR
jgi:hypothetical protein